MQARFLGHGEIQDTAVVFNGVPGRRGRRLQRAAGVVQAGRGQMVTEVSGSGYLGRRGCVGVVYGCRIFVGAGYFVRGKMGTVSNGVGY